jgi:hypothetical protein
MGRTLTHQVSASTAQDHLPVVSQYRHFPERRFDEFELPTFRSYELPTSDAKPNFEAGS